jgi:hypothetical protein
MREYSETHVNFFYSDFIFAYKQQSIVSDSDVI